MLPSENVHGGRHQVQERQIDVAYLAGKGSQENGSQSRGPSSPVSARSNAIPPQPAYAVPAYHLDGDPSWGRSPDYIERNRLWHATHGGTQGASQRVSPSPSQGRSHANSLKGSNTPAKRYVSDAYGGRAYTHWDEGLVEEVVGEESDEGEGFAEGEVYNEYLLPVRSIAPFTGATFCENAGSSCRVGASQLFPEEAATDITKRARRASQFLKRGLEDVAGNLRNATGGLSGRSDRSGRIFGRGSTSRSGQGSRSGQSYVPPQALALGVTSRRREKGASKIRYKLELENPIAAGPDLKDLKRSAVAGCEKLYDKSVGKILARTREQLPVRGQLGGALGSCAARVHPALSEPPFPVPNQTNLETFACWDEKDGITQPSTAGELMRPRSLISDVCGLAVQGTANAVSAAGDLWLSKFGPLPNDPNVSRLINVNYPDVHGRFHGASPRCNPTLPTDSRLIDKVNRYLDEVLAPRYGESLNPDDQSLNLSKTGAKNGRKTVHAYPGPLETKTQTTGNKYIDSLNRFLDEHLLPEDPEPEASTESAEDGGKPRGEGENGDEIEEGASGVDGGTGEEPAVTVPKTSSFSQKLRCTFACRDFCQDGMDDCAGLAFQKAFLEKELPVQEAEPTGLDKFFTRNQTGRKTCADGLEGGVYREKIFERWCPSLYNREDNYCRFCDRNLYTGREKKRINLPKLQNPIRVTKTGFSNRSEDIVNFDIKPMSLVQPMPECMDTAIDDSYTAQCSGVR